MTVCSKNQPPSQHWTNNHRCGTDWLYKNHPSWRQRKSADITSSNSISTLSCGRVQANIRGFRKYETLIVVGNELRAVTWQRNNPAHTQPILQWWARGRVWPLHAVVKLHSIKSEPSKTGAGDCWGRAKNPLIQLTSAISTAPHLSRQLNSMLLQSCHSMYCMYLNSHKATRGKCSVDHQAQGYGCSEHRFVLKIHFGPVCFDLTALSVKNVTTGRVNPKKRTTSALTSCGLLTETGFLTLNEESS